jgi:hypothetical protein
MGFMFYKKREQENIISLIYLKLLSRFLWDFISIFWNLYNW